MLLIHCRFHCDVPLSMNPRALCEGCGGDLAAMFDRPAKKKKKKRLPDTFQKQMRPLLSRNCWPSLWAEIHFFCYLSRYQPGGWEKKTCGWLLWGLTNCDRSVPESFAGRVSCNVWKWQLLACLRGFKILPSICQVQSQSFVEAVIMFVRAFLILSYRGHCGHETICAPSKPCWGYLPVSGGFFANWMIIVTVVVAALIGLYVKYPKVII